MSEERSSTQFRYKANIDGIAEQMGKRSNSIANTYLLGLQERNNALYVKQMEGSLVCLTQKNSGERPSVGLPLPKEMFEAIAYNIRLVYCGNVVMLGVVQNAKAEEFVVQSSNWIGNDLSFTILKMKGA